MDKNFFDWDEKPELNITPLVDIMLVLLAILMVTTPTITYKEDVSLPKGSKKSRTTLDERLEILISLDKKIFIKDVAYEFSSFPDNFNLLASRFNKNINVYIKADKKLAYENVIFILKSVREAGFSKVSLITT